MAKNREWDFSELENEPWEDDEGFEELGFDEFGEEDSELERISAYEVGGFGELDEPREEPELDEPWQMPDLEEADWEEVGLRNGGSPIESMSDEEIFGFIKKIGRGVGNLVKKGAGILKRVVGPLLKTLGPIAARIVGGAIGGPAGAAIGGTIANAVLREGEIEADEEAEEQLRRSDSEFLELGGDAEEYEAMQDCAEEIAHAETEGRALRGFAALARRATRMFRRNRRVRPAIPHVLRAALALVRTFRANRRTQWAIKAIPLIIRRTLTRLARARRIDRKAIVVAMARETAWVLANQRRAMLSMRRGAPLRGRRRGTPRRSGGAMREELSF